MSTDLGYSVVWDDSKRFNLIGPDGALIDVRVQKSDTNEEFTTITVERGSDDDFLSVVLGRDDFLKFKQAINRVQE